MLGSRRRLFICHAFCELLGRISDGVVWNFFKVCTRGMAHRLLMSFFVPREIRYFVRCQSHKNRRICKEDFAHLKNAFGIKRGGEHYGQTRQEKNSDVESFGFLVKWRKYKPFLLVTVEREKLFPCFFLNIRIVSFRIRRSLFFTVLKKFSKD